MRFISILIAAGIICAGAGAPAHADAVMQPTLSAYPQKLLRQKTARVTINIRGAFAEVITESDFVNDGTAFTGGVYSFPLPGDARATGLWYSYGDTTYRAALHEIPQTTTPGTGEGGFTAELNAWLGANRISMKIDSIAPGGIQTVALRYIQPLRAIGGTLQLCYPLASGDFSFRALENFSARISVQKPLETTACTTSIDSLLVRTDSAGSWTTFSYRAEKTFLCRDFGITLPYASTGYSAAAESGRGVEQSGYAAGTFYPPSSAVESMILPRHIGFLIDVSRSMSGYRLQESCRGIAAALASLRAVDTFFIDAFDGSTATVTDPVPATADALTRARTELDSLSNTIGTSNSDANTAITTVLAKLSSQYCSLLFVFSDGYTDLRPDRISNPSHASIFPVAIGGDVARERLEMVAQENSGFATFIGPDEDIAKTCGDLITGLGRPILAHSKFAWTASDFCDLQPPDSVCTIFAGVPIPFTMRFTSPGPSATHLDGTTISGDTRQTFFIGRNTDTLSPAVEYVMHAWAAEKIRALERRIMVYGGADSLRSVLVDLSLRFQVRCRYTSYQAEPDSESMSSVPSGDVTTPILTGAAPASIFGILQARFLSGSICLQLRLPGTLRVRLFNCAGRQLGIWTLASNGQEPTSALLPLSGAENPTSGAYILIVDNGTNTLSQMIMASQ